MDSNFGVFCFKSRQQRGFLLKLVLKGQHSKKIGSLGFFLGFPHFAIVLKLEIFKDHPSLRASPELHLQ